MQEPLITVIVPIYNLEGYLERCIESIINQTYKNIEIILVDDGSKDNSAKLCDEYAKKDKRIKVIHKENGGVSSARNLALDLAKGDFITFADSDDYLDLSLYQKMMQKQLETNADLVFSRFKKVIDNKVFNEKEIALEEFCKTSNLSYLLKTPPIKKQQKENSIEVYNYVMCSIWRILFKKSAINHIRFNSKISFMEDAIFLMQVIINSKPIISFVDEYLYYYLIRQNSSVRTQSNLINNSKEFVLELENLLKDTGYEEYIKVHKFYFYLNCISHNYTHNLSLTLKEIQTWNNKENYKAYCKVNANFKTKLKSYLAYHKMFVILKMLLKLNKSSK